MIANEFGEAQGLHRSALFAAALVLFVLTLLVNAIARVLVKRTAHGASVPTPAGVGAGGAETLGVTAA